MGAGDDRAVSVAVLRSGPSRRLVNRQPAPLQNARGPLSVAVTDRVKDPFPRPVRAESASGLENRRRTNYLDSALRQAYGPRAST